MKSYLLNAPVLVFSICLFFAFKPVTATRQGIAGYVYRISGNQMPMLGKTMPAPKKVKATLYIFRLTNISQVVKQGQSSFYSSVGTRLVKRISSNSKGYFSVQLPPGRYSIFAKKDSLYYANQYDDKNNIFPVLVRPKKMTKVDFRIDYDAVY